MALASSLTCGDLSILSFFPPSTTLRRYLRTTYATTAEQIGQLYCDIVSYATVPNGSQADDIVRGLIAVRLKLKRNLVLKQNVSYEVFPVAYLSLFVVAKTEFSFHCAANGRRNVTPRSMKYKCEYLEMPLFLVSHIHVKEKLRTCYRIYDQSRSTLSYRGQKPFCVEHVF